jgi:rsbT co-antagonist protein RsbR
MSVPTETARPKSLMADLDISEAEIIQRKEFLQFVGEDSDRLLSVNDLATAYADPVIEDFYQHLLSFDETRLFFRNPRVLDYVKRMQKEYFLRLTQGDYNSEYIENRLKIGAVHERIGLPVKTYLGAYNFYLRAVADRLIEAYPDDLLQAMQVLLSLMKLVFLDIGLAIDTYIVQRERTIREQQEAIRELSTPVLQVREQLLILPIVGMIDALRARQLTEGLLRAIRGNRARVVVIDITGVPAVDSAVANHLVQTVDASRLMGATVIVTGLSPEIAQTLVTIGVDLTKMNTVGDLQGGIEEAERLLGYQVVRLPAAKAPEGGAAVRPMAGL